MLMCTPPVLSLNEKRVLVVPLRFVGDAVVTLPLVSAIKSMFPASHVSVLVSAIGETLFGACDAVDELVREKKQFGERFDQLKAGQYDVVMILRQSFTMALLCQLAGIPVRCGYDRQRFPSPVGFQRSGFCLTHVVPYPSDKTTMHQAEHHLEHLKALTGKIPQKAVSGALSVTPDDEVKVRQLLKTLGVCSDESESKKIAVIHGVSASASKQVSLAVFTASAQWLCEAGYTVFTTGTPDDFNDIEAWIQQNQLPIINVAGQTTLLQLYVLLQNSQLLIGLDSGPVHVAGLAKTPTIISLYGATNPKQWGPLEYPLLDASELSANAANRFYPVCYSQGQSVETISAHLLTVLTQVLH